MNGTQSVLQPLGPEAARVSDLTWMMFFGGGLILIVVMLLVGVAILGGPAWRRRLSTKAVIIGGGIVFPIVTLTALLLHDLTLMRAVIAAPDEAPALRIAVVGEQWWWRIIYTDAAGNRFESANEIRIPTGRRIELTLTSADVIHSFWVPNLAGKLDMIPGRTNVLTLAATEAGVSRGQCAEFCGGAHALMSFYVIALPPAEFNAWLVQAAAPAATGRNGEALFVGGGCGGCHAIRGTPAIGRIGPDLTHLGERLSLAAGTLRNDEASLIRWIADNQHIKPENRMPPYRIFSDIELSALAGYLVGLN